MTHTKSLVAFVAASLIVTGSPALAQTSAVQRADQKDKGAEQWRLKHHGNTELVRRANLKDRREIAHRDRAATAVQRANARDAKAEQWRLAHKGDTAAVRRANAKEQGAIDYRNSHSRTPNP